MAQISEKDIQDLTHLGEMVLLQAWQAASEVDIDTHGQQRMTYRAFVEETRHRMPPGVVLALLHDGPEEVARWMAETMAEKHQPDLELDGPPMGYS
ncbi:hypothetical protein T8K17_19490 [Thalassobaculum sp. OXR-137]|uniref:hypothetical protein n=1 Tax=Thalassobaculum sp. OXR-137 TaxID=3100173 RepID=UPI002AC990A9|nr:hypothetical protein [Thalassobaculum sp. OXR-137]WPZ33407.1 hypothetical protein T8K17_19490 [Thalassobaculum sp. OXR-137]